MDFGKVRSLLLWCGSEGVQQFVANVTYTNYSHTEVGAIDEVWQ